LANDEQQAFWNDRAGPIWVTHQELLDQQIRPHGELALAALAALPGERIIDLGCGCGDSALALARAVGPTGHVLAVDVSGPMLERARERQQAAGVSQLEFRRADAQTVDFGQAPFDAAFSRFGVMFFDDPAKAFANIGGALHPGGRLAFVCWSAPQENPWITVPMGAAAPLIELPPPPPPNAPGMFALADPLRTRGLLEAAGFQDVAVEAHSQPMALAGGSLEEACELFLEIGPLGAALRESGAGPEKRAQVGEALRVVLGPHVSAAGRVELGSTVWWVTAQRSG
jgi:SAM-dependent methyltransferase